MTMAAGGKEEGEARRGVPGMEGEADWSCC